MTTPPRGVSPARARMHLVVQFGSPVGALAHLTWAVLFWQLDLTFLAVWNLISGLAFAAMAMVIHKPSTMRPSIYFALFEIPAHGVLAIAYVGIETSFWLYAIAPAMLAMGVDFWPRPLRSLVSGCIICFLAAGLGYVAYMGPLLELSSGWKSYFAISNVVAGVGQLALMFAVFDHAVERTEFKLKREYDRAEGLLRNILPDAIALRLKDGETVIADEHKEVSVVFADIVDFTDASARLSPRELVETLNTVFSAFDALATEHGAEKIKTIGDAYMVVVGAPEAHANHAEAAVALAQAMHRTAAGLGDKLHFPVRLRIGVNSGPVVAGVIGSRKFAYDLWGDAVNVASRMESHGDAGKVMISDSTRALLPTSYAPTDEGLRDLKGKGPTQVWSLRPEMKERKAALC